MFEYDGDCMMNVPAHVVDSAIRYWFPVAAVFGPVDTVPVVALVTGRHFWVPAFDHPVGGVYVTAHATGVAGIVKPSPLSKPVHT